jgi:hypothetical protein
VTPAEIDRDRATNDVERVVGIAADEVGDALAVAAAALPLNYP